MPEYTFRGKHPISELPCAHRPVNGKLAFARLQRAVLTLFAVVSCAAATWLPLEQDGVHDPAAPGLRLLQQPAEALSKLSPDTAGNNVRWVEALEKGQIKPRESLRSKHTPRYRDDDILMNLNGGMPIVRFPHRAHTMWLDCSNCHDELFKPKAGANKLSMFAILEGEQCGVCHGAVSFPLTECSRCHSVERADAKGKPARPPQSGALVPIAK